MQRRKSSFLILLPVLLLSACSIWTGVPVDTVPVEMPQQFSVQGDQHGTGPWWSELNDPALSELIDRAFAENFSLSAARERLIQARALARQAGADRLPTLDGQAKVGETWSRDDGSTSSTGNLLLGLSAAYEVDLWGRIAAREDAAVLDAEARAEDLQTAALSLAGQIADTWYQLAAGNHKLSLLEKQQEVNKMGLELIRIRFTAGQVGIADMLQQEQLIE